ncbi:MAG: hypothetical protein ACLFP4_03755 [Spirochaetales bacterium]
MRRFLAFIVFFLTVATALSVSAEMSYRAHPGGANSLLSMRRASSDTV